MNIDDIMTTPGSLVSSLIGACDHRQRHVHEPANPVRDQSRADSKPVYAGCNNALVPEYYADLYEHDEDDELLDDEEVLQTDGYFADREDF